MNVKKPYYNLHSISISVEDLFFSSSSSSSSSSAGSCDDNAAAAAAASGVMMDDDFSDSCFAFDLNHDINNSTNNNSIISNFSYCLFCF